MIVIRSVGSNPTASAVCFVISKILFVTQRSVKIVEFLILTIMSTEMYIALVNEAQRLAEQDPSNDFYTILEGLINDSLGETEDY